MTWTAWNWINVLLIFVNGWFAIDFFRERYTMIGSLNLFASALNTAIVAVRVGL